MFKDLNKVSKREFLVDYEQLIRLLPKNVKFTEDDLPTKYRKYSCEEEKKGVASFCPSRRQSNFSDIVEEEKVNK